MPNYQSSGEIPGTVIQLDESGIAVVSYGSGRIHMLRRNAVIAAALAQLLLQSPGLTQEPFAFRVVASGLKAPWEVTWGPDDRLWITERTAGRIVRVNPADGSVAPAATIGDVYPGDSWHEGLLGMALHPDLLKHAGRDYVYVAYTYDADPGPALARRMKLVRYTFRPADGTLAEPLDLVTGLPANDDHGGGRLAFGPDQKLYLTRGDNGANWLQNYCLPSRAQDLPAAAEIAAHDWSAYAGKILRIDPDGAIPSDNPVFNGVRSHVYSVRPSQSPGARLRARRRDLRVGTWARHRR